MHSVSLIGRTGATAGVDGAASPSSAQRSGATSFGKSLEYVFSTASAEMQRNERDGRPASANGQPRDGADGVPDSVGTRNGGQQVGTATSPQLDAERRSETSMDTALRHANARQAGAQTGPQPLTPNPLASRANLNLSRDLIVRNAQDIHESQSANAAVSSANTVVGTRSDTEPSTLDPGSMAFLLAWLGGGGPQVGGQSLRQQQQSYLESYRQRCPNGVPGITNYITATTNYLTRTA